MIIKLQLYKLKNMLNNFEKVLYENIFFVKAINGLQVLPFSTEKMAKNRGILAITFFAVTMATESILIFVLV